MAQPTREQMATAAGLKIEYGEPDRVMMEKTEEVGKDQGLMYIAWFAAHRILFIRPNGKRQWFEGVAVKL